MFPDSRAFGRHLRALRQRAGKTQADLADAAGLDATYLSKIETGATRPPAEWTIIRLLCAIEAPDAEYEQLLLLAGRIPGDIRDIITEHPDAAAMIRAWHRRRHDIEGMADA